ncbi:MAG: DUF433 domain-containing protein [Chloroflexota bacterium]
MKQVTIRVQTDEQAKQITEILSDFDFIVSVDVDTLWPSNGEAITSPIKIIESDIGPMISESRVSVYDVMDAHDEGYTQHQIRDIYNLSFYQIEVALEYIEAHRARLEPELERVKIQMAENEAYHRALVAEHEEKMAKPMTPERAKFNALLEKSRRDNGNV